MIQLAASLSPGLVELILNDRIQIDAVEVGPWFTVEQIHRYQQQLPDLKFYFHHSNLISRLRWVPGTRKLLLAYIRCTHTPWISLHCSILPPGYVWLANKFGWYLPHPDQERALNQFITQVKELNRFSGLPVLLENMPAFPHRKYSAEISAVNISRILHQTGSRMLLDIAHARVVASVFRWEVRQYLSQLPLDKVVQIHVSGTRQKNGFLFDAHEPLDAEDYDLLEWVLKQTKPSLVTLEYFRGRDKLHDQLSRIRNMLSG